MKAQQKGKYKEKSPVHRIASPKFIKGMNRGSGSLDSPTGSSTEGESDSFTAATDKADTPKRNVAPFISISTFTEKKKDIEELKLPKLKGGDQLK